MRVSHCSWNTSQKVAVLHLMYLLLLWIFRILVERIVLAMTVLYHQGFDSSFRQVFLQSVYHFLIEIYWQVVI